MKRSSQPFFWALFGAGGMFSALVGAMLVFISGIGVPLGWLPRSTLDYAHVHAFALGLPGRVFLFALVSLFLWHAAHRIFHTLHDLGVHTGRGAWLACYGVALAGTLGAAAALLAL